MRQLDLQWISIKCLCALIVTGMTVTNAWAMGNYPDANSCPNETPYYSVCTSSSHGLLGWSGPCRATKEEAQKDADEHARKFHNGDTHWTGVARARRE
jgi:hypothetical protein